MRFVEILRTPGHRRSTLLRRALALVLLAAGIGSAVVSRTGDPEVAVFARDVAAGAVLGPGDTEMRRMPPGAVPSNALTSVEDAEGKILAAGASAGEVATSTRLVGPDLAGSLVPPDARGEAHTMVPVVLAEPDIIPMLHHGARVRVITVAKESALPVTVAEGGRVVVAGAAGAGGNRGAEQVSEATVLLLLRDSQAAAVAAASLSAPLTVVLEGPRPGT